MAVIQTIDIGAAPDDDTGDTLRDGGDKINDNFAAVNTEAVAATTKLAGIEAGATADQTASEILAALLTVDGTGTSLDADLLDGQQASAFATAAQGATADAALQAADIGDTVQAHSAALDATTAAFTTAQSTKLAGIEASADVTDAANVEAAGAVMTTGAQLVSADANNDLTVNPKFWSGTETEYAGLTPSAGTVYLVKADP